MFSCSSFIFVDVHSTVISNRLDDHSRICACLADVILSGFHSVRLPFKKKKKKEKQKKKKNLKFKLTKIPRDTFPLCNLLNITFSSKLNGLLFPSISFLKRCLNWWF